MGTNQKVRTLNFETAVKSAPFKKGTADYHAGRWSEVTGGWRKFSAAALYESGRLVAAATGCKIATAVHYSMAIKAGAFPASYKTPGL